MRSGASSPAITSRTVSSSVIHTSRLPVRTVPANEPICGMALAAWPALTAPHTMTVPALGSIRRLNTPGNPVMTVPSPYTRSAVRCGREVCPPGECRVISTVSAADVIAPARIATLPTSRRGSQCKAKILVTPAIAPVATTSMAPPGMTSSAGWKIRRTPTAATAPN